ncbi:MAG: flagellar hook-length control protein FliK [Phycisphaerales bacterium]
MENTLDMSIATMICDNAQTTARCESGGRSKAASGSEGEGTQQRFADVLPIARAALERPSKEEAAAQDADGGESAGVQTEEEDEESTQSRRKGETGPVNLEAAGWSFVGIIQPAAQPPKAVADGQMAVSVESNVASAEQTVMAIPSGEQKSASEAGVVPVSAQMRSQAAANTQLVGAPLGEDVAADTAVSGQPQTVSPVALSANSTPSAPQPATETSLPATTGDEQATSVRKQTQETSQVAQTAARIPQTETADAQANAKDARVQSVPVPQVADSASQTEGADASATPKPAPGSQSPLVSEASRQASDKAQPAIPQTPANVEASARSEKNIYRQAASPDGQQNDTSKRSETVLSESKTIESLQSGGKDVSPSGAKDVATMPLQHSVSSAGETTAFSQRPVVQTPTQPQVSSDTSAVRSPAQSIGEQILDSVQASAARGDKQVLVRLNPPELGTVLVRFQEQGDFLTGTLEVSSKETRREIEQALPQVARTLQEAGIQVRRLEVVASDLPERDLSREHAAQDAWSQHQGTGQNREQPHASGQTRWSQSPGGHSVTHGTASEARSQTAAAQGRIDLLL